MKNKVPTIKEIAKIANVSLMTVSRALNNNPRVREQTRKKILNIAKELNYRPNRIARSLVSKKSNLISLIVADIRNQFFAELARGIEDKAWESGYNVIISSTDNDPKRLESQVRLMMEMGVDGFILASVRLKEPIVDTLIQQGIPVVLVNRKLASENVSYVVIDNQRGAYLVMEHLITHGCRNIAIINGSTDLSTCAERLKGYKKALTKHGLALRPEYVANGSFTKEHGYTAAKKMLSMPDRPDAIFGASDLIALGAMKAADELGFRIPDDLSLVGFDDTEFSSNPRIDLTTVSQRKYEMGRLGVQVITEIIEGTEANYTNRIVLEPHLIVRNSGGCEMRKSCAHST